MNILSEPLVNYVILFTFTFMHLADAFIQSDLQCIQVIHFFLISMFSFLIFFSFRIMRIVISNLFKKNCDSQFVQNHATRLHVVYYCI